MGTHPIFESDFDCLTASNMILRRLLSSSSRPATKASIKDQMRAMEKKKTKSSATKNLKTKLAADTAEAQKIKQVSRLHRIALSKAMPDVFPDRSSVPKYHDQVLDMYITKRYGKEKLASLSEQERLDYKGEIVKAIADHGVAVALPMEAIATISTCCFCLITYLVWKNNEKSITEEKKGEDAFDIASVSELEQIKEIQIVHSITTPSLMQQQLVPTGPDTYLASHRALGAIDFVTGEPTNESSLLTAPVPIPPYFVRNNYLFGIFPNIPPLLLSEEYEQCQLSDIIKYELWASVNSNWRALIESLSSILAYLPSMK